jgi:hypothetical protein
MLEIALRKIQADMEKRMELKGLEPVETENNSNEKL